jgi:hypothetical protein
MVLEDSLFQNIEAAIKTLENPDKILFVHFAENSHRHLNQGIGLAGWQLVLDLTTVYSEQNTSRGCSSDEYAPLSLLYVAKGHFQEDDEVR